MKLTSIALWKGHASIFKNDKIIIQKSNCLLIYLGNLYQVKKILKHASERNILAWQ